MYIEFTWNRNNKILFNIYFFSEINHHWVIWVPSVYRSIGGYFASSSQDRTAKLWVSDRIYPVRTFAGHNLDVDVSFLFIQ